MYFDFLKFKTKFRILFFFLPQIKFRNYSRLFLFKPVHNTSASEMETSGCLCFCCVEQFLSRFSKHGHLLYVAQSGVNTGYLYTAVCLE